MADYDWGPPCGCGFMQDHRDLCKSNPRYAYNVQRRADKAEAAEAGYKCIDYSNSLWGCGKDGTVVWDWKLHRKVYHPDDVHPADKIKDQILNG